MKRLLFWLALFGALPTVAIVALGAFLYRGVPLSYVSDDLKVTGTLALRRMPRLLDGRVHIVVTAVTPRFFPDLSALLARRYFSGCRIEARSLGGRAGANHLRLLFKARGCKKIALKALNGVDARITLRPRPSNREKKIVWRCSARPGKSLRDHIIVGIADLLICKACGGDICKTDFPALPFDPRIRPADGIRFSPLEGNRHGLKTEIALSFGRPD